MRYAEPPEATWEDELVVLTVAAGNPASGTVILPVPLALFTDHCA